MVFTLAEEQYTSLQAHLAALLDPAPALSREAAAIIGQPHSSVYRRPAGIKQIALKNRYAILIGSSVTVALILIVRRYGQKAAANRDRTEREIIRNNQQEALLQDYVNTMEELLLHEHLRGSAEESEVRTIARVRTVTVLPRLNADRKRSLLQFLYEADLINEGRSVVALREADLCEADLGRAHLEGADFSGAYLSNANLRASNLERANLEGADLSQAYLEVASLSGANLRGANLRGAHLLGARLEGADLSRADLSRAESTIGQLTQAKSLAGTIMPDRTRHS
jgi:hypothetical protein